MDELIEEYKKSLQEFRKTLEELTERAKAATDTIEKIREKYEMEE